VAVAKRAVDDDLARFVGRPFEGLSLSERWRLAGCWIATERYSPERLPLRIMEAVGPTAAACIEQLRVRGLDPARYEFQAMEQPYQPS
jgi:hypothetical protein